MPRRPTHRAYERPPRGGFWHVSLCIPNNRWRMLPFVGAHAEADYIADEYRRHCRRVAVYREGQPVRERVAPVLPKSYRLPRQRDAERDPVTIQQLLAEFVRSNDAATAMVLSDALIEDGYDWAAHDLRETIAMGCRTRRGLAERILSEVLNGSAVLEHGEWYFPPEGIHNGSPRLNPYVLILERNPVRFRGGKRHTAHRRGEPRIVLWSRYGSQPDMCRWRLFGTYDLSDFDTIEEAEATARADIRAEKVPAGERRYRELRQLARIRARQSQE